MSKPQITVAICTRDRASSLERALSSIARCRKPPVAWELIVVDNGSVDLPASIFAKFAPLLPLRVVREHTAGHSIARNAAVHASKGAHIIWTDDDVVVEDGWLCAYWEAFNRWPDAAFFGGAIELLFEPAAPKWLEHGLAPVATAFASLTIPPGETRIESAQNGLPFGANMAFRARDLRRIPFDHRLGRGPSEITLGDETAVMRQLLERGCYGVWVPSASVHHVIGPDRQTTAYLWDYFAGIGTWKTAISGKPAPSHPQKFARWMIAWMKIVRYWRDRALAKPKIWTASLRAAALAAGEADVQKAELIRPAVQSFVKSQAAAKAD